MTTPGMNTQVRPARNRHVVWVNHRTAFALDELGLAVVGMRDDALKIRLTRAGFEAATEQRVIG